jgi:hypothetical protein
MSQCPSGAAQQLLCITAFATESILVLVFLFRDFFTASLGILVMASNSIPRRFEGKETA